MVRQGAAEAPAADTNRRELLPLMAYEFDVVAWEAWPPSRGGNGQRRGGVPGRPQDAHGLKVLLTNPDDPSDTHQFWAFTLQKFQGWGEWWLYVSGLMGQHGMELADDGIPPDPQDRDRTGKFRQEADANFYGPGYDPNDDAA